MKELKFHYARYGTKSYSQNVKGVLKKRISENGRLNAPVNKEIFGDPCPGEEKHLHVIFTFNGVLHQKIIGEGKSLIIPTDLSNMSYIDLLMYVIGWQRNR